MSITDEKMDKLRKANEDSMPLRKQIFDLIPKDVYDQVAFVNHAMDAVLAITMIIANGDGEKATLGMEALLEDSKTKISALSEEMLAHPEQFFEELNH